MRVQLGMGIFNKKAKKAKRIFMTVTDIAAIIMSLIYIIYVVLMLLLFPPTWLNWFMLCITLLYIIFFVVKLLYINTLKQASKIKKYTKRIVKYTKYGMRFINVIFVISSIVTVNDPNVTAIGWGNFIPITGVITFVMTFTFTLIWDIGMFMMKRKIRSVLTEWNNLDSKSKKDKIDFIIEKFLETLDGMNISGFEEYIDYGAQATRILGKKVEKANKRLGKRDQLTMGAESSGEVGAEAKEVAVAEEN
jgi:hypothetical protein